MKKKIFCLFFATLFLLSAFPLMVFASSSTNSSSDYVDLASTDIEYDFNFLFAGQYKIEDYKEDKANTNLSLIAALESKGGFSTGWELYLYIYNPSRQKIVKSFERSNVNMAKYTNKLGDGDNSINEYSNYTLGYVSSYDSTIDDDSYTDGLIIKYCVGDVLNCSDVYTRYYRIVEFELLISGDDMPRNYIVSKEYGFKNRTINSDNNKFYCVNCFVKDLSTVELDAYHTFYRVNTEGINQYTDIQSTYFPVPNALLKAHKKGLGSMKAIWTTYKLNNALVTNDTVMEFRFNDWMYGNSPYFDTFKYSVVYNNVSNCETYRNGYNIEAMADYIINALTDDYSFLEGETYDYGDSNFIKGDFIAPGKSVYDKPLSFVFFSNNIDSYEEKIVDGKEVIEYLNDHYWNSSMYSEKQGHSQTFYVEIEGNKTGGALQTYEKCKGWEAFFSGGWFDKSTDTLLNFDTFFQIEAEDFTKLSNEELSNKYLVDIGDVNCGSGLCGDCMRCHINDKKYNDCTWFLLRYDTTDFQAYDALVCDNPNGTTQKACVFNIEAINAFDILSVGFADVNANGDTVYTVYPVGRPPTQFSGDGWSPDHTPTTEERAKEWYELLMEWIENTLIPFLKIAFVAVCALFVVQIILPFIPKRVKVKVDKGKDEKNE